MKRTRSRITFTPCEVTILAILVSMFTLFVVQPVYHKMVVNVTVQAPIGLSKGGGDRPRSQAAWSTRSKVNAQHGAAATSVPQCTQIALDILKKGGTAVDAAIAANACTGLMEPTGSGIGGDVMAIVWHNDTRKLYGLNGSGRSPKGLSYSKMQSLLSSMQRTTIPPYGCLPISVPGCVDGWFELHGKFGKLPMSELLQPAIDYARNGFAASPIISSGWRGGIRNFINNQASIPGFPAVLGPFGPVGPEDGQIHKNPDLANTLETIAIEGRDAFYKGSIAAKMDSFFKSHPDTCFLRMTDFETHKSTWEDPLSTNYRGYDVYELHPSTQGASVLQMLNLLEGYDIKGMGYNSPDYLHVNIEAKKVAFADRAYYYSDPAFASIPIEALVSKEYANLRRNMISMTSTLRSVQPGNPAISHSDTIYLTTADQYGNMVSFIQSNFRGMGSGVVVPGLGFIFQDRGELYDMKAGSNNQYEPGKRPFHTIIPAFVMKDGNPFLSFGVMGGDMQPMGHVQIIQNMVDFGMDVQAAGDLARWQHYGDSTPEGYFMTDGGRVRMESGINDTVRDNLRQRGHVIDTTVGSGYGGYQAIQWNANTKTYSAASEMRKDGYAAGY